MLNRTKTNTLASAEYREAMSRMAGAVSIVTTDGPAGVRGVTVSAVVSVSDNPPTLFVCLNRNREENRFFEKNGCFAINTLCAGQLPLARAFAGEGHLSVQQRFALGEWRTLETGAPILLGARMSLDCVVTDVQTVHTHFVIAGEAVAKGELHNEPALIYLDRNYLST
ncbi:MAG TPA: flavin reductase [Rhizobiaceae bacterium]|nr:flavin reductase [Rhizobiaceae bacterium]